MELFLMHLEDKTRMKRKNLLVCYTGSKGGVQYAYNVTKNLIPYFDEIDVIIASHNEMIEKWRSLPLHEVYELDTYSSKKEFVLNTAKLLASTQKRIKNYFSNREYSAVYVPMTGLWTGTIVDCIKYEQLVVTLHDPISHTSYTNFFRDAAISITHKLLKYDLISKANKIVILSQYFLEGMKKRNLPNCKDIVVIPLGNTIDIIQTNSTENKNNENIRFLFFGRIDKYKGIGILVEAYETVKKKHKNVSLTIAGSGDIEQVGVDFSKIEDLQLENRWIEMDEIQGFFDGEEKTITVLPYIDATQSGIIPIAQATGSLVLCSNVGGLPEQVDNGKTGVLFEANNVNALVDVMEQAICNPLRFDSIIKAARRKADENSWESIARKVAETIML